MNAYQVYKQSDGKVTKAYYDELEKLGPVGVLAMNLFRAQKCSSRAKKYRYSYRSLAYGRKNWSLRNLCAVLAAHAERLDIRWGWKRDPHAFDNPWVLYCVLPQGQVSFHSPERFDGPDFVGEWDGQHLSAERILKFCDYLTTTHTEEINRLTVAYLKRSISSGGTGDSFVRHMQEDSSRD